MAEDKVLTKHPLGKRGRSISKQKYEAVKRAMLSALRSREMTHTELFKALVTKLKGKFDGNISWYGETVKLDLEARKAIIRTASKPQLYRLKNASR
jgi:plasmid replication initiation protein